MLIPLHASWTIKGDSLPERLLPQDAPAPAFRLPGTDALLEFADLIGAEPEDTPPPDEADGAPFALPALIPEDAPGEVMFTREVDFGSLTGDWTQLSFDMLCGQGSVTLTSLPPRFAAPGAPNTQPLTLHADFTGGPLTLDVTPALRTHRRFALTLRFGAARPAGACGPILLRTAHGAALADVRVAPDTAGRTLELTADVQAFQPGDYALRACLSPAQAPSAPEDVPSAREISLHLSAGEAQTVRLAMGADLPPFIPGSPYAAPGVKLWLNQISRPSGRQSPCDSVTLMCGMPGSAPAYTLPLAADDLRQPPETLVNAIQALHVTGVSLPGPASDMLYRLLTRAGISALHGAALPPDAKARLTRYPCAAFSRSLAPAQAEDAPALSAWQLCGLTAYPRIADPGMLAADLLREAAGREIDPAAEDTQAVLAWLRAFSVRLRAEAMRQGKAAGTLCAPGEFHQPDIAQAIQTALAPMHLSALPLCGAWWTGAHFSASLAAFIPRDVLSVDKSIRAEAVLEDGEGRAIARTEFPCAPWRSGTGLMECTLPDTPCVLELITRLYADEEIWEESSMPVYVGERGPLESAF